MRQKSLPVQGKLKYYLLMHLIILIWGFTGVIGKLLDDVPVLTLVMYRMLIGGVGIGIFILLRRKPIRMARKTILQVIGTGWLIALHWLTFFLSIHFSNVSFALIFFSTTALFTCFLEPWIMKKKFNPMELIMGAVVVGGITIIGYDSVIQAKGEVISYKWAMVTAIISAFLAALFSVINAKFVQDDNDSVEITFFELMAGCLMVAGIALFSGGFNSAALSLSWLQVTFLLILGLVCTAFAFFMGNWLMKFITPFTMNLNINMEPIYAIVIALAVFGDSEVMSPVFYIGAVIIIGAIFVNAMLKGRNRRKAQRVPKVLDEPHSSM